MGIIATHKVHIKQSNDLFGVEHYRILFERENSENLCDAIAKSYFMRRRRG